MNRRRFVLASLAVPLVLAGDALASTNQGIRDQASSMSRRVTLSPDDDPFTDSFDFHGGVHRAYILPELVDRIELPEGIAAVSAVGGEFATSAAAREAMDYLLADFTEDDPELGVATVDEVSIGRLGDDRSARSAAYDAGEFSAQAVVFGLTVIRKDRYLQALVAVAPGPVFPQLAHLAHTLDPRWPSANPWTMMPDLADVRPGMVLDVEEVWSPADEIVVAPMPGDEEPHLTFTVELLVSANSVRLGTAAGTCAGVGEFAPVDAGSTFEVRDQATAEVLTSATLSAGTLEPEACSWRIAVLGLEPRQAYDFVVGTTLVGEASYDEIAQGEVLRFEVGL